MVWYSTSLDLGVLNVIIQCVDQIKYKRLSCRSAISNPDSMDMLVELTVLHRRLRGASLDKVVSSQALQPLSSAVIWTNVTRSTGERKPQTPDGAYALVQDHWRRSSLSHSVLVLIGRFHPNEQNYSCRRTGLFEKIIMYRGARDECCELDKVFTKNWTILEKLE